MEREAHEFEGEQERYLYLGGLEEEKGSEKCCNEYAVSKMDNKNN